MLQVKLLKMNELSGAVCKYSYAKTLIDESINAVGPQTRLRSKVMVLIRLGKVKVRV